MRGSGKRRRKDIPLVEVLLGQAVDDHGLRLESIPQVV